MKHTCYFLGLALLLAACGHSSPTPQPVQALGNWQVTKSETAKDKTLCYAGSAPVKSAGTALTRRAEPYLMVTKRSSGKLEVSASSGYPYMRSSEVSLVIDDASHHLFFKDNVAWVRGRDEDLAVINAVKAGSTIEVRGVSAAGKTSIDSYSPHGFWQAIAALRELCP